MNIETLTPAGIEIYGPDMLGQTTGGFVPFSVRCPNFIQLNDHTIVYFFEAIYASQLDEEPSCRVLMRSHDGGKTWSEFHETFIETPDTWTIYHYPSPGIGIQLKNQKDPSKNGRLIMPCNHAKHENGENEWGAHLLISDDFGDTWHMGVIMDYSGANESVITELSDGTLVYNCRNQGGTPANLRIQGFSYDGGDTLTDKGTLSTLYDPSCHAGFTSTNIHGKDYIFFTAPSGKGTPAKGWFGKMECWGKREALMLCTSSDGGKTYREIRQLSEHGTFAAYSAIYATMEGQLLCAWESGPDFNQYRDIKYTILDMKDLIRKYFNNNYYYYIDKITKLCYLNISKGY